ncbi:MAG: MFS transporter [Bacteroidetes bacterium]|nr:MAG: MFS transporter [Bacteroidota bacterium]
MTERSRSSRRLILFSIIITSFINPFLGAAINIALPSISEEFSLGAVGMSWVSMAFLLSSAVFLVPLGKLADIRGRKKIFFLGNIIIAASSILCALSLSGSMLILLRAMQGIGSAMVFGTGMAIITSVYPPKERGKAIGVTVTSVYIGLSLAPFLGGILTQYLGWRSIFYVTVPFELLVLWITWRYIKEEWADAKEEKFDLSGSIIYLLSMSAFMFGFSRLPETSAIVLVVVGLIGLFGFGVLEMKVKSPIFNLKLFASNRLFAFSNLAALINYATTFAITFLLSLYLQYILGLSPRDAGFILITQPVMMAIIASISGRLSDRYDPRILASAGMGIITGGLIMLTFLTEHSSITYLSAILAIVGFGFGMFSSPNTNAIMGSVDRLYLGVASATVGTMRLTGQMMSMGIATLILQVFIGNNPISTQYAPEFMSSMRTTFIVFVILCIVGLFSSLARGRSVREER